MIKGLKICKFTARGSAALLFEGGPEGCAEGLKLGICKNLGFGSARLCPPNGGGGFTARTRILLGHVFMFVGLWGYERRKVIQVWLKNNAHIDTQIC